MEENKILVLIIDDDDDILKVISANLKLEGYDIITAQNGIEAYDLISGANPDIIILDLNLPDMDGCSGKNSNSADGTPRGNNHGLIGGAFLPVFAEREKEDNRVVT